jgi:hypothetical protein
MSFYRHEMQSTHWTCMVVQPDHFHSEAMEPVQGVDCAIAQI